MTVAVLAYPRGTDLGLARARRGTPLRVYRRALAWKANPRDPEHMRRLVAEHWPEATVVDADEAHGAVAEGADEIVLVYPDAIGLFCGRLERRLLHARSGHPPPTVLNGRGRRFTLDRATRRALLVRRALERTMLAEVAGMVALTAVTPILLAADLVRGRR